MNQLPPDFDDRGLPALLCALVALLGLIAVAAVVLSWISGLVF